jgi:hypothetical protein
MAQIDDIDIPKLIFPEAAAPGTPAAGKVIIYSKADGLMYQKDDAGTETQMGPGSGGIPATIFDAAGDIIVASAADTAARLAIGAANTVPKSNGTTLVYAFPPGHTYNYTEDTSGGGNVTATTEATANTLFTASAGIALDGSTEVDISVFIPSFRPDSAAAGRAIVIVLYDDTGGGAASIGKMGAFTTPAASTMVLPCHVVRRLTPSAATHTYSARAYVTAGTGAWVDGAGGSGNYMPAFIKVVKA